MSVVIGEEDVRLRRVEQGAWDEQPETAEQVPHVA
jgi:hypothetical protein